MSTRDDLFEADLSNFLALVAAELSEEEVKELGAALRNVRQQRSDVSVDEAFDIVRAVASGNLLDAQVAADSAQERANRARAGAQEARARGASYLRIQSCLLPLRRLLDLHPTCGSVEEVLETAGVTWLDLGLADEDVPRLYQLWSGRAEHDRSRPAG
ncbi:hypothetical protein [Streptomyces silvensis]|uniref:Uncharacterized protein n=1 Tax=Streptomyces silvensis TaxID=1765722 RepID=A0A0W7X399_9ACTN|nr:hypothetical protein [Streptomyces silvensis]KUF17365.1 hypothetical protein AT728_16315 [Streptomyces silvensis]